MANFEAFQTSLASTAAQGGGEGRVGWGGVGGVLRELRVLYRPVDETSDR